MQDGGPPDALAHAANDRRLRVIAACLALAGILFAAYVSFVPFHFAGNVTLHQAATALLRRRAWVLGSRSNFVGNIILFLPVGFAAAAAVFRRGTGWGRRAIFGAGVLLLSATASVSIESLQAFLPGRVPAVSDCVAQTIGTLTGIFVWTTVEPDVHAWWSRRRGGGSAARLSLV